MSTETAYIDDVQKDAKPAKKHGLLFRLVVRLLRPVVLFIINDSFKKPMLKC